MFLLNGLASLELSKQPEVTKKVVGWLLQPGHQSHSSSSSTLTSSLDDQYVQELNVVDRRPIPPIPEPLHGDPPQISLEETSSKDVRPTLTLLSCSQSDSSICTFIWSLGKLKYDDLDAMTAAAMALQSRHDSGQQQDSTTHAMDIADVVRCLWSWAKLNRHPGEHLLDILHQQWRLLTKEQDQRTGSGASGASVPSYKGLQEDLLYINLCTLLYSLAMLKEHMHPLFQLASTQLGKLVSIVALEPINSTLVQPGSLRTGVSKIPPQLQKQLDQIAVALLMAQADRSTSSPLNAALSPLIKAEALMVWRSKVLSKAQKRPNRYDVSPC
jgi:hypothetical protein